MTHQESQPSPPLRHFTLYIIVLIINCFCFCHALCLVELFSILGQQNLDLPADENNWRKPPMLIDNRFALLFNIYRVFG